MKRQKQLQHIILWHTISLYVSCVVFFFVQSAVKRYHNRPHTLCINSLFAYFLCDIQVVFDARGRRALLFISIRI